MILEAIGTIPYIMMFMSEYNIPVVWVFGLLYDQLSPYLNVYIMQRLYIREVQTTLAISTAQMATTRFDNCHLPLVFRWSELVYTFYLNNDSPPKIGEMQTLIC
jgi:hypothetical protein